MITVFAILIAAVFACVGLKKKFFVMWAMVFNLIISIYLSVMLVHAIGKATPDIGESGYFLASCLIALAALFYAIFHVIVKFYIIGNNVIEFSVLFDRIGAPVLGFLFGYLACCFILFALGIMPIAKHEFITNVLGDKTLASIASPPVKRACAFTGYATLQCYPVKSGEIIDWLMTVSDEQQTPEFESGSAREDLADELAGGDFKDQPTDEMEDSMDDYSTDEFEE
jgi:hypothetical protein